MIYYNIEEVPYKSLRDALEALPIEHKVLKIRTCKDGAVLTFDGQLTIESIKSILKTITPKDFPFPKELREGKDYRYVWLDEISSVIRGVGNNGYTYIYSLDGLEYKELAAEYHSIEEIKEPLLRKCLTNKALSQYNVKTVHLYPSGEMRLILEGELHIREIRKILKSITPREHFPRGVKINYEDYYHYGTYSDNKRITFIYSLYGANYINET